ncbi:nitroreductase family protein [Candidatus Bipolaricaulota bacterium]|nr:nitroreductase family protein [Candidatus Bipolaricaulota bacterium]
MNLYKAINRRRSIRNYGETGLSKTQLDEIEKSVNESRELFSGVSVDAYLVRDGQSLQQDISGIIADYGKVEAPHYLVLTSEDTQKGFVETGYRYEFIVLALAAQEVGTCWIGKGFRDEELSRHVQIPRDQTCTTLIALGPLPAGDNLHEIEDPKRKELSHFLINGDPNCFDEATLKIVDCLRRSPSSLNSQPWRVVLEHGAIHLYLRKRNKITRMVLKDMDRMNQVDAGIGLCHLEVGGRHCWDGAEIKKTPHPEKKGLVYIGSLKGQDRG